MGRYVNGAVIRVIGWVAVALIVGLNLLLLVLTISGRG